MIIIDNFLNKTYADKIEEHCIDRLEYSYGRNTSYQLDAQVKDSSTYDIGQMTCPLIDQNFNHYFANTIRPMVWLAQDTIPEVEIKGIARVKVNLLVRQQFPDSHYNCPHQDGIDSDVISMVYYVNDSDGDTFLFNEFYESGKVPELFTLYNRVSPKKNRLVIFESNRYHASSNPKLNQDRFIINFVLEGKLL